MSSGEIRANGLTAGLPNEILGLFPNEYTSAPMKKPPLPVARTRDELRGRMKRWRKTGARIGFVPTMGALHEGHLSLVRTALAHCDRVVASIYVNPQQFAPGEDFESYPRSEANDLEILTAIGCDLAYCPQTSEMYPEGSVTTVHVEELSDLLDGVHRPHFFYGVTTVVARLFTHVAPDVAVFGDKDFQQLQIIKRMVRDLGFVIEVIGGEIIREPDGLAMSSRNAYLSPDERRIASALFAALHRAGKRIGIGVPVSEACAEARAYLTASGMSSIDYIEAVDPATLVSFPDTPAETGLEGRLLGAVWLGKTRLIDNLSFSRVS